MRSTNVKHSQASAFFNLTGYLGSDIFENKKTVNEHWYTTLFANTVANSLEKTSCTMTMIY